LLEIDVASIELDCIDNDVLRGWVDDNLSRGNKIRSVARKVATVKSFFKFLFREGLVDENPTERLALPRIPKKLPTALSQDEIRQLLNAPEPSDPNYLMNRAILIMLYSGGLRVSELVNLRIEHVNIERLHVRVPGKGAKERLIPLQIACQKAILDYLLYREEKLLDGFSPRDPLFVKKTKTGVRPINVRMVQYLVEQYGRRAGLMTHIHPHLLRHSIATHLIEEGANVETVRQTLGHEDLATTSIYLKSSSKYIFGEHKKYNPTDVLIKNNL
jgi:site-specific recombinase XerD